MLDIGCGNGATLRAFGRALPGWDLAGFEVDAKTRDEVLGIPEVTRFFEGELGDVDESFDCMTLIHVLEHLPDPRSVFAWIASHLAPGGVLLVQSRTLRRTPST